MASLVECLVLVHETFIGRRELFLRRGKKNYTRWDIMIATSPDKPMRRFSLSQWVYIGSISVLLLLPITIITLTVIIDVMNGKQSNLNALLEEKEIVIEEQYTQINKLQRDYLVLEKETKSVQQTIEEFKAFEERLWEMQLDMPADMKAVSYDGSGGTEIPESMVSEASVGMSNNLLEMKEELPALLNSFEELLDRFQEYEEELRTIPTYVPAEGRITSQFGNRRDPFTRWTRFHSGIDIAAPLNTPIYAAADGKVTMAGWNGGYGNTVIIQHDSTYKTLYAHLNKLDVEVEDVVKKGDIIGRMGTTGRSTGVHLHYEIKKNGEHVDPYMYMTFHQRDE